MYCVNQKTLIIIMWITNLHLSVNFKLTLVVRNTHRFVVPIKPHIWKHQTRTKMCSRVLNSRENKNRTKAWPSVICSCTRVSLLACPPERGTAIHTASSGRCMTETLHSVALLQPSCDLFIIFKPISFLERNWTIHRWTKRNGKHSYCKMQTSNTSE